jgi:hypothetical protein
MRTETAADGGTVDGEDDAVTDGGTADQGGE